jgi:hypothetical protein
MVLTSIVFLPPEFRADCAVEDYSGLFWQHNLQTLELKFHDAAVDAAVGWCVVWRLEHLISVLTGSATPSNDDQGSSPKESPASMDRSASSFGFDRRP